MDSVVLCACAGHGTRYIEISTGPCDNLWTLHLVEKAGGREVKNVRVEAIQLAVDFRIFAQEIGNMIAHLDDAASMGALMDMTLSGAPEYSQVLFLVRKYFDMPDAFSATVILRKLEEELAFTLWVSKYGFPALGNLRDFFGQLANAA